MTTTRAGGPTRLDPDELAALEEQRDFLLRSLADLEREHDAGDLADDDHRTLKDDYTARAAEVLRALDEQRSAFANAKRASSAGRRFAILGGVAAFGVVAAFLIAGSIGARGEGDTLSGGITTKSSPSQRAQACTGKINTAPTDALSCFQGVLDDDPENVVALTWTAWTLELSSAQLPPAQAVEVQGTAGKFIERAIAADPDYSYARAFRAVIAFRHGEFADAERYLADFRAGDPSADAEAVISSFELDRRIDEALADAAPDPSGPSTTTSTTTP